MDIDPGFRLLGRQKSVSGTAAKEVVNKMQRQPTEWKRVSASRVSARGLTVKTEEGRMPLTNKTTGTTAKADEK